MFPALSRSPASDRTWPIAITLDRGQAPGESSGEGDVAEQAARPGKPASATGAARPAASMATRRGRITSMSGSVPEVGSTLRESRGRALEGEFHPCGLQESLMASG